jgi:hypothetical protein
MPICGSRQERVCIMGIDLTRGMALCGGRQKIVYMMSVDSALSGEQAAIKKHKPRWERRIRVTTAKIQKKGGVIH